VPGQVQKLERLLSLRGRERARVVPAAQAFQTGIRARGLLAESPLLTKRQLRRRSGHVGRACRMVSNALVRDKPATNTPPKRWHGHIARRTRSSGQISGQTSTTSAERTITATRKPEHTCVSRTRSLMACARQREPDVDKTKSGKGRASLSEAFRKAKETTQDRRVDEIKDNSRDTGQDRGHERSRKPPGAKPD